MSASNSSEVRCPGCCRVEVWTPTEAGVESRVIQEGGHRRPVLHPILRDFETWAAARRGETGPVVGVCGPCGRLMFATPAASIAAMAQIELSTDVGTFWLSGSEIRDSNGVVDVGAVQTQLRKRYAPRPTWKELGWEALRAAPTAVLLVPFLLWIAAAVFTAVFLLGFLGGK